MATEEKVGWNIFTGFDFPFTKIGLSSWTQNTRKHICDIVQQAVYCHHGHVDSDNGGSG